jgi:Fibronectin type III domain
VRPRTLLLFAFVALLGAATAVPALASASEVKLEVNNNCEVDTWACWAESGSTPKAVPESTVTIALGGKVKFVDNAHAATVSWLGTPPTRCSGIPASATTDWEGTCEFETAGTYHFESPTLFNDGVNNYTKYEVVVTGPPTPTATTEQATAVTETEATLNGDVNPEGQATSYYFEYGTTTGYGSKTTETSASGVGRVSAALTGLSPNTTYDFQLVAVYGAGKTKVEGGNTTFKTAAPPSAPTASTQSATGVSETEATLKGTVDPDGEATEYFFEYGTEASYGQKTGEATLPASESNQTVSATVKGLAPGTQYHFRLVAKNKLGPVQGNDLTFMAASTPSAKAPAQEPSPTPTPTGGNPTATTTSSPSSGQPTTEPPASGPLFGSVKLASTQHGGVVHGSLVVSSAGSGGHLQIELLTKGSSAPVGKFLRSSLRAGKLTFTLALSAKAKHTLKAHHRLALTAKIVLTPLHGPAVTTTRSVVLHA